MNRLAGLIALALPALMLSTSGAPLAVAASPTGANGVILLGDTLYANGAAPRDVDVDPVARGYADWADAAGFSPDGTKLVVGYASQGHGPSLRIYSAGKTQAKRLDLDVPGQGLAVAVSPAGDAVAVATTTSFNKSQIYIAPLNGGTPRLLLQQGGITSVAWQPGGNLIAYTRRDSAEQGGSDIWMVDAVTGASVNVTNRCAWQDNGVSDCGEGDRDIYHYDGVDWAPDGSGVATLYDLTHVSGALYTNIAHGIAKVGLNGDASVLFNYPQTATRVEGPGPVWSPDGTTIALGWPGESQLRLVRLSDGAVTRLGLAGQVQGAPRPLAWQPCPLGPTQPCPAFTFKDEKTKVKLHVTETAGKIKAKGKVSPAREGKIRVTLEVKKGAAFSEVARKTVKLKKGKKFSTTFTTPSAATCRVTAFSKLTDGYKSGTKSVTFSC